MYISYHVVVFFLRSSKLLILLQEPTGDVQRGVKCSKRPGLIWIGVILCQIDPRFKMMVFVLGWGCYNTIGDHPKVSNVKGIFFKKIGLGDIRVSNLVSANLEKICKLYLTAYKKYFTWLGQGSLDSVFYAVSNVLC